MTKIAAYTDDAIYGLGETAEAAIDDACGYINAEDEARFRESCNTAEMTSALIEVVEALGGNCAFGPVAEGRIGTWEEHDKYVNS